MTIIGFYEARTRLSELLDDVANGKQILITRRGKPAAVISPPPKQKIANVSEVVGEMLRFRDREGPTLGDGITIRQLIEQGRRF
ncbi:MAG: type II toxin-antitoxin system Phd/YefM family antitoxin [Acidobacteria bacterium]|nr:type II toxin-antitoxin system Phd/YefM family antitoxin [Acidobacteriota bacterium]